MLHRDGIVSIDLTRSVFPNHVHLVRPKAVLECFEEIPCNPCATSCPFDAIYIGDAIHHVPTINLEKCTGCGLCVVACPGLAIYTVQINQDKAVFKIPYEMPGTMEVNQMVQAINRKGEVIGEAKIVGIKKPKTFDCTALVTIEVDIEHLYDFITVRAYEH